MVERTPRYEMRKVRKGWKTVTKKVPRYETRRVQTGMRKVTQRVTEWVTRSIRRPIERWIPGVGRVITWVRERIVEPVTRWVTRSEPVYEKRRVQVGWDTVTKRVPNMVTRKVQVGWDKVAKRVPNMVEQKVLVGYDVTKKVVPLYKDVTVQEGYEDVTHTLSEGTLRFLIAAWQDGKLKQALVGRFGKDVLKRVLVVGGTLVTVAALLAQCPPRCPSWLCPPPTPTPTPTPTVTPTLTPTLTPTMTPTATLTPTVTPIPSVIILPDVPLYSQYGICAPGDPYTACGPTTLAMLLAYAGYIPDSPSAAQDVVNRAIELGLYDPDNWPFTDPADLAALAEDYAPGQVRSGEIDDPDTGYNLLWQELAMGNPVLVDVRVGYDLDKPLDSHFALVVGIDAGGVYLNDPYGDGTGAQSHHWVPRSNFEAVWNANPDGVDRWWMVVEPSQ